jgi:hypothetical protein
MATVVFVLAGAVYVVSAVGDLGFVPGLMPAFPIAIGVMVHRPSDRSGVVATMAVVALPLVWAFQYLGGAGPQWGGRYTLVSAVLLGVLALEALRDEVLLRRGLLALTALVTAIGLVWMGVRTRAVDDLFTDLAAVDADVLIARDAFLLREGGAVVLDEHWLTATGVDTYAVAVDVAERSGASTVAVVEPGATALPADAVPRGWQEVGHALLDLAGRPVAVVVFDVP